MAGCFITIEGVDGSGKSTQVQLLEAYLRRKGYDLVVTQEPGGTVIGDQLRQVILDSAHTGMTALTEVFLYAAARAQHLNEVIEPALRKGKTVLCSRFYDSTFAYQGYGAGVDLEVLEQLNHFVVGDLRPDLTIVFDLDPGDGLRRVAERGESGGGQPALKDRMERKNLSFHEKVRKGFLELASKEPDRIKIVKADGDKTLVFAKACAVIDEFLMHSRCGRGKP